LFEIRVYCLIHMRLIILFFEDLINREFDIVAVIERSEHDPVQKYR